MILTFIMLLLSTKPWISDKISCMLNLCLEDSDDPPALPPACGSAPKPDTVLSGSMLSWICGYMHRGRGVVSHFSLVLPSVCPRIITEFPVLTLLHSGKYYYVDGGPASQYSLTQECAWVGSSLPRGRRTQCIKQQSAASLVSLKK